jgi:hypothetical protein
MFDSGLQINNATGKVPQMYDNKFENGKIGEIGKFENLEI